MKQFLLTLLALCAIAASAFATQVTVAANNVPYAQLRDVGGSRSIVVSVTDTSTTVTAVSTIPAALVGVGGWKIAINGTDYTVSSVESTSSLTLSSAYSGASGTATATVYPVVTLNIYVNKPFVPLGASYVVQSGNPEKATGFYVRTGCTYRSGQIEIPAITLDSMLDSATAIHRLSRFSAFFFRIEGSRIGPYAGFESFQVPASPTSTSWTQLAIYNAPSATFPAATQTYSTTQIDALIASVAQITGLTTNQLLYAGSATSVTGTSNATLNSSGDLVAHSLTSSGAITGQTLALNKTSTANILTMLDATVTGNYAGAGLGYVGASFTATTSSSLTGADFLTGLFGAAVNANAITVADGRGIWGRARNSVASAIMTAGTGVYGEVLNSNATAQMTAGYGGYFRILNSGTMTDSFGVYVGDVTSGTQTNRAYSFYASDVNARNYFAGDTTIAGRTITTDADAVTAGLYIPFTLSKADANSRTFYGFRVKPTINTPGNSNTTLNVLSVDTTNTDVTGVTTNLLHLAYGGAAQFYINSSGNVTGGTYNGTTIPSSKTLVVTTDTLAVHAATTSSQLAGVISDETGSGSLVFATSPVFTTPSLGVASATSLATSAASPLLLTNGQLVTVALTSQTVGGVTLTIPDFASVADEFTFKTKAQTMSNKTFVAPVLGAATATSIAVGGGTAITKILTGSASLDFGATAAGTCDTLTIAVTSAADGDEVFLGIPNALAAADTYQTFYGWVSGAGTVSVKRCNLLNSVTALSNPSAATVNVTVIHH